MYDYEMFKTVRMKGFDRDEVLAYIQMTEETNSKAIADLQRQVAEKDQTIADLREKLVQKDEQRAALETEIDTKYKKYVENYEKIGSLVYESQVKGDEMIANAQKEADRLVAEAQKEADAILQNADAEAAKRTATAEAEVDNTISEGKLKYIAIQDIMNEVMDQLSQAQRKFVTSFKEVHEILQGIPDHLNSRASQGEAGAIDDDDFDGDTEELPIDEINEAAEGTP